MTLTSALYHSASLAASGIAPLILATRARGRTDLSQRFGAWNLPTDKYLWFHGASVGEVAGLLPLIQAARQHRSNKILLTATSVTGFPKVADHVEHTRLLPFDHPIWIKRALGNSVIEEFIFGETELWPALIELLSSYSIPMYMVNAKISDASYKSYKLLKPFIQPALERLTAILCSDQQSVGRFLELGAPNEKVQYCGNTKFDREPSVISLEEARQLKMRFFGREDLVVLTLGSLRPGEENIWFPAISGRDSNLAVIVAPRHQEKFEYFASKLKDSKIDFDRWSQCTQPARSRVLLLDTLGELEKTYSFSDGAFIGGSIADFGGHNPLEAAAYGTLIAMGPFRYNAQDPVEKLRENEALFEIFGLADANAFVDFLLKTHPSITELRARTRYVFEVCSGATERICAEIFLKNGSESQQ